MGPDAGRRFRVRIDADGDFIASEEDAALLVREYAAEIVEVIDPPPEHDGFEVGVARLQEKLPLPWLWSQAGAGNWLATTQTPERLALWLVWLAGPNDEVGVFSVHATLSDIEVPPGVHTEMTLFCAAANQFFSGWNLYLGPYEEGERVVSTGGLALESGSSVPPEMIEAFVWRSIMAAVVAAPAVRAVTEGADAREAVAIADLYDDTTEWSDLMGYDDMIGEGQ